ncbi:hypothetical protein MVEN_01357900 [Mycena venus]|uniref:Transmembrane protein n=1 Tax=Mycena venus TaxID=2733690 RepID=A0A8H6XY95_9AGAR|nr:hypothetical protein MVEN_01357900 [Mycena venus]
MHLQKTRLVLYLVDRAAKSSNVAWISPLEQDIYGPGSTILAKWASRQTINSPSFRLCMVSSSSSEPSGCGATVWPEVTESAGQYQAPVTVPDDLWDGLFFLEMKDASEAEMRSPVFALSPTGASEPVTGSEPQAQAPLGPANLPTVSIAPLTSSLVSSPVSSAASINPNVLSAKSTLSPASYAVPLSAVAAIILIASLLFLKHRRKRGSELQRSEKLPSRTSSCKSNSSEVGHAFRVLSRHYGYAASSPPKKDPKPRPPTLDAFPYPAYAQWGPPALSYGYEAHSRDSLMHMTTHRSDSPRPLAPVEEPCRDERARLPPDSDHGQFHICEERSRNTRRALRLPTSLAASHIVRVQLDAALPAPRSAAALPPATPSPAEATTHTDSPLGSPPADRECNERELYARVASKLSMYRPRRS